MLSTLTKTNQLPLAYVCVAGGQTDLVFDGGSMCFNSKGELEQLGKTYEEDFFIYDTEKQYTPILEVEKTVEEEITAALTYGLKEYADKTGFKKALIGLKWGYRLCNCNIHCNPSLWKRKCSCSFNAFSIF